MNEHGFEFTPAGIIPIGSYKPEMEEGHIAGATANVPGPAEMAAPVVGVRRPLPAAEARPQPIALKPVDVVRMAKARLRDVEREIKRLRALEKERNELKRLIDAAAGKPLAVVRDISAAKRG